MPKYSFEGRSHQGQSVNGELDANSVDAVAGQLMSRGVTPIKIQEVSASASYVRKINTLLGADRVNDVELIMFSRQMYTITKSGIPLTRGLRGLAAGVRHDFFRDVINDLAERLETGVSLSQAMGQHPKVFNNLYISLINVGENSGKLDAVFRQIGGYIERDLETKKSIKAAMRYPTFIVFALAAAITAINILVVPAFARMFKQFNTELPILTKLLIGMSDFFVNYWLYMLVAIPIAYFGVKQYIKTPDGEYKWGMYRLKIPIVGGLVERASMARYARSFSLMLNAGVPITQSLNLCAAAIDNPFLAKKIITIREGISRGEGLLHTHYQAEMFTPLVLQMIAVGEESGQVEELLHDVAEFYEREVDYDLKTLTARIEPILIITMAVFVTILALGIFLPIWNSYGFQG